MQAVSRLDTALRVLSMPSANIGREQDTRTGGADSLLAIRFDTGPVTKQAATLASLAAMSNQVVSGQGVETGNSGTATTATEVYDPYNSVRAPERASTISSPMHLAGRFEYATQVLPDLLKGEKESLLGAKERIDSAPNEAEKARWTIIHDNMVSFFAKKREEVESFKSEALKFVGFISNNYTVSGQIFTESSDGKLQWGVFEVRNGATGEFYFGRDDQGVFREWDGLAGKMYVHESILQ